MSNDLNKTIRVGIIGDPGHVNQSFLKSTKEINRYCTNTGNLAFRYAVTQHIASPKRYLSWDSQPSLVRENCDLLVFPAANQIDPRFDWRKQADFIEKVNLPCLIVGLGAQATDVGSELNLQEGTLRWLKSVAERCQCIGVRGEYTADVLAKIGIKNIVVTGCPSNFINPNPGLGSIIEKKLGSTPRSIVVTDGAGRERLKRVEQKLIDWMCLYKGNYICQSPINMVALARKRFDEIPSNWLKRFHKYLLPRLSYEEFIVFVKQHFYVFFDAGAWLEFLSSIDLSLGTRLHGNMLAIQSSTPGICICHDSRTQELCNTTLIPHVSVNDFLAARNIEELVDYTSFEGDTFDRNRAKLAVEYKNTLIRNGVEINLNLNVLANAKEKQERKNTSERSKLTSVFNY